MADTGVDTQAKGPCRGCACNGRRRNSTRRRRHGRLRRRTLRAERLLMSAQANSTATLQRLGATWKDSEQKPAQALCPSLSTHQAQGLAPSLCMAEQDKRTTQYLPASFRRSELETFCAIRASIDTCILNEAHGEPTPSRCNGRYCYSRGYRWNAL